MIHLQDLTMNKEDVVLAPWVRKGFNEIKKGNFNKEQIITFENNLFFVKDIDFGLGCVSKAISLHLYRLMNHMQQSRLKKLKNNKLAFICSEIRDLNKNFSNIDFQFDDVDIEDNFDYFYKLPNINYEKRTSEEIIKNIKEKMK